MLFNTNRPIYLTAHDKKADAVWTYVRRMLQAYVDITFADAPSSPAEDDLIVDGCVDSLEDALEAVSGVMRTMGEREGQDELVEFGDVLFQAIQIARDELEDDQQFPDAVAACLNQVYGGDFVVVQNEDGEELRYEVLYRTELDEKEYAVLVPVSGESDGSILILQMIYDEEAGEVSFEDADEETAEIVFDQFREVFAEDFDDAE